MRLDLSQSKTKLKRAFVGSSFGARHPEELLGSVELLDVAGIGTKQDVAARFRVGAQPNIRPREGIALEHFRIGLGGVEVLGSADGRGTCRHRLKTAYWSRLLRLGIGCDFRKGGV